MKCQQNLVLGRLLRQIEQIRDGEMKIIMWLSGSHPCRAGALENAGWAAPREVLLSDGSAGLNLAAPISLPTGKKFFSIILVVLCD